MRVIGCLLFILLIEITTHGTAKQNHLHLRIYVPDIVNRHVHTKTVYVHLLQPIVKKKPKSQHKHVHYANWSSWNSYGNHHAHKDEHGKHELSDELEDLQRNKEKDPKTYHPVYHRDSYYPQPYEDNNLEPNPEDQDRPRYAVHEHVNDVPPNGIESFSYEEGYRKGLQSESGHIRSGQSNKFLNDQNEEQDDDENEGYKEDFEGKTDAGRYLVDEVEYENTRDKRDGLRGRRRVHKM